jgi:hypothetical protein
VAVHDKDSDSHSKSIQLVVSLYTKGKRYRTLIVFFVLSRTFFFHFFLLLSDINNGDDFGCLGPELEILIIFSALGSRHKICHTVTPYFRTLDNLTMPQQGSATKIFLKYDF